MVITKRKRKPLVKDKLPPGGLKILKAFKSLLRKKEFNTITTAELAEVSGVNEALLYKYFGSKRGLLHSVLFYILENYINNLLLKLKEVEGALNKLKVIVRENIASYQSDPVFAKIMILEVRNYPGYFQSDTYQSIRKYAALVRGVIKEGVRDGEIREDISSWHIMQIIIGSVEHLTMPTLLFRKKLSTDELADMFCDILFEGIRKVK